MSARDELVNTAMWGPDAVTTEGIKAEAEAKVNAFALELAKLIQDPKRWERFGYRSKSMTVYMSAAKRAARIIELEVESHG